MANTYCRHLSNGFRFLGSNLTYQPCCWVPASPPVNSIEELNQYRNDITNLVMANKKKYCYDCYMREQSGFNNSLRQNSFRQIPKSAIDGEIIDLSIQIDTTCNAACSICGPQFSSLWRKELQLPISLIDASNSYIKLIKILDLSKVNTIRFFGGEPLVNDNHLILLNEVKNPHQTKLMYSTNGSIFPNSQVLKVWDKFKRVDLVCSIDDISDRFHYIRWPLQWNKVADNMERFAEINSVQTISINCTINPLNILYFDELENWFNNLKNKSNKFTEIEISACYGVWGTDATPKKLREQIIAKYSKSHKVVKLLSNFPEAPGKWDMLVEEMKRLDSQRNLLHQTTFSSIMQIMQ